MIRKSLIVFLTLFVADPALAQARVEPAARVQQVMAATKYGEAVALLDREHDRLIEETIRLTEIPAPPFKEAERASVYLELMRQYGLGNALKDEEGNILGLRKGTGGPLIAVVAHLDTVFPEGTNVKVRREGTRLLAPGVADDTRGLAVMLALIRALDATKIQTENDILFVGSVGEEGLGDLRGVKHLFLKGAYKDKIKTFIGLDGGPPAWLTATSVGSRRYRLTFAGPGGHSYFAFGTVNPMYAMGKFLVEFGNIKVPAQTTYSASVAGGGTSVNAVPGESWMEIDMRSASPVELARLESRMKEIAAAAADAENQVRSTANGKIELKLELLGDRPAGSMSLPPSAREPGAPELPVTVTESSPLVLVAAEAISAHGLKPDFRAGSTDANVPMSIGIPAITLSPGTGGQVHSLDEWGDADKALSMRHLGIILTTLLTTAGMRNE